MKKGILLAVAAVFLYAMVREITLVKVLLIAAGLAGSWALSRVPARYFLAMRYPVIALSLLVTASFFFYPPIHTKLPMEPVVIFFSFYSIAFYLVYMGDKGKGLSKEVLALSILFLSACFNLFLMGKPVVMLAMSVTIMLFLFIVGRMQLMAVIAGYTLGIVIYLVVRKTALSGLGLTIGDIQKYVLLGAAFLLLMLSFSGFMKKPDYLKVLAFFGFLYLSVDILLVLGFKLSAGLLYQPVIALFILAPIMGIMLKEEGKRA